jgi:uncharacterized protein YqhQ
MKNLKNYLVGFADGFGKISLQMPYFYYSFNKENNLTKEEKDKFSYDGFKCGIGFGICAIAVNLSVYFSLVKHDKLEYLLIPIATNLLSFIYEKSKDTYNKHKN